MVVGGDKLIYIFNKLGELKTILSNDNPKSCPYTEDLLTEKIEYGEMRLDFSIPANHDDASIIELDDIAATLDSKNQLVPLKITFIDSGIDSKGQALRILECDNQGSELLKHPVRPMVLKGVNQRQALEQVLAGSGWEAGIVEGTDVKDFEVTDYSNGVKEVNNINDNWGGEVRFHIEISEGRIKRKTIDSYQMRGNQEGYGVRRFESGRDLLEIRKQTSSRQIYTAIIGLGKENESGKATTFTEISKTYTNENGTKVTKPVGQDWIGDPDALQQWGLNGKHAFGYYINSEEFNPSVLLDESWKYLQQNKKPNPVFVTDIAYFKQKAGYAEDDEVQIGDKVTVSVLDFNPPLVLSARVLELQTSKSDPTKNKVVLGEYQELKIKRFDSITALQKAIKEKQARILYQPTPPNPYNSPYWVDNSKEPNVLMRYDFDHKVWMKASPTEASEIGAETPEGAQDKANKAKDDAIEYTNDQIIRVDEKIEEVQQEVWTRELAIIKQDTQPTGTNYTVGQLWLRTTDDVYFKWTGSSWKQLTPSLSDLASKVPQSTYESKVAELQALIDDKADAITTYTKTEVENKLESKVNITTYTTDHNAVISRLNSTETRISQTETDITFKANQTDLDTVAGRVTEAESQLSIQADEIASKVSLTVFNDLEDRVNAAETRITQTERDISLKADKTTVYSKTETDTKLGGKADQSALDTTNSNISNLATRITNAEAEISVNAEAISLKVNQSDFNLLTGRVSNVESTLTVHGDEIEARVTKTEFNNFTIGGRNLALNTGTPFVRTSFNGADNNNWAVTELSLNGLSNINSRVILSAEVIVENIVHNSGGTSALYFQLNTVDSNGSTLWVNAGNIPLTNGSYRIVTPITKTYSETYTRAILYIRANYITSGKVTVKNLKIEKGNLKPTDWTPAPEDIEGSISGLDSRLTTAESSITQNANEISSKVSQTTYNLDVSDLKSRMSSAESSITQNASAITSKVSITDYNGNKIASLINQSATTVKIQAAKIELQGQITISSLDSSLTTKVNNGDSAKSTIDSYKVVWDRASNINSNGTFSTSKLSGSILDSQISSASKWNNAESLLNSWKSGSTLINGGMIATSTIFTKSLLLADFTNLCENPDFEQDTPGTVPKGFNPPTNSNARVVNIFNFSNGNGSGRALEIDAWTSGNSDIYMSAIIPVVEGDEFYAEFEGRYLNSAGSGYLGLGVRRWDKQRNVLNSWSGVANIGTFKVLSFTKASGTYKVPLGTGFVQFYFTFTSNGEATNKGYVDNIIIRRKSNSNLIVDGAITANHLNVNSLQAMQDAIIGDNLFIGRNAREGQYRGILFGQGGVSLATSDSLNLDFEGKRFSVHGELFLGGPVTSKVEITQTGASATLLHFNMERGWRFIQHETGSSASLGLKADVDNKYFRILAADNSEIAAFKGKTGDNEVLFGGTTVRVNASGGVARWMRDSLDYIRQDAGGRITFYMGGIVRHAFNTDGTKTGGTVDIDGETLGMSPVDSPQVLLTTLVTNVNIVAGQRHVIFLEDRFAKAITEYAVFPSCSVRIVKKEKDIFYVESDTNCVCDFMVYGKRVGYESTYWMDL